MIAVALAALLTGVPALPALEDRRLIQQAKVLVDGPGERVWTGLSRAPFQVLLVDGNRETLFCRPAEKGFQPLGYDAVTGCRMQARPRELAPDLAASFAALGGTPVIVMATRRALENDPQSWVMTVVHEDFHQFQSVIPGYEAHVRAIKPASARGDDWMLTYPFPYADEKAGAALAEMFGPAKAFLNASSTDEKRRAVKAYVAARLNARRALSDPDWRYYEFQTSHEGVARWTEVTVARLAGKNDPALAAFALDRRNGLSASLDAISRQGLKMWKRDAFYVLGAIEAEMLDSVKPDWKRVYLSHPFSLGDQLSAAVE